MERVTVGVDPPRAWAIWSERGLIAWDEVDGRSSEARREAKQSLMRVLSKHLVEAAVVEVPFGTRRDEVGKQSEEAIQTALVAAESAGWWQAAIEDATRVEPRRAHPATWRSELGFPGGLEREEYKNLAVRFAGKMASELGLPEIVGPRGGLRVDASEAICISMVAWKWRYGITGALRAWKDTGSFGGTRDTSKAKAGTDN